MAKGTTYAQSGVDIERGNQFAGFIKGISSPAVSNAIGGFASGFAVDTEKYREPLILSSTDGVGTKLLVAKSLGIYDTVGIDLVAMCVNDLIVCGAEPVSFLDYIACGTVNMRILEPLVEGIVKGCEIAGCTLSGGETAELPGMYGPDDFDLAGFSMGVVEKSALLPKKEQVREGDVLLGLRSSGIHSNGFSLARKVITDKHPDLYRKLLTPTRIFTGELKILTSTGNVLGAAHITGGGLRENTARILPSGLAPDFNYSWPEPEIFNEIRERGSVSEDEMRNVFNLGLGIVLIVHADVAEMTSEYAASQGVELLTVGSVVRG